MEDDEIRASQRGKSKSTGSFIDGKSHLQDRGNWTKGEYKLPSADPLKAAAEKGALGLSQANIGDDFTDEELEFMKAMEAYKAKYRRKWPGWSEALAVLKSLGYRIHGSSCSQ